MQINYLSPDFSVAPQIAVVDVATIAEAGFKSVICNRPDQENPETHQIAAIKAEVIAAGLEFAENVFDPSTFGPDKIQRQSELLQELPSPVLAYCASGTRCSIVWAFAHASSMDIDSILTATTSAGYQLSHLRPQLEATALNRAAV
jgi:uncharacterized protein (TIGR01244 family)